MKKIYILTTILALFAFSINAQTVLYSNDFEEGGPGDATIVGTGQIIEDADANFNFVYHNAAGGEAVRSEYLVLPSNIFADLKNGGTNELTISFWVNVGTSTADTDPSAATDGAMRGSNHYSVLFSAYGDASAPGVANGMPMMVLESRYWVQMNDGIDPANWTDCKNEQNVNTVNAAEHTNWLADGEWHFYAATFTPSNITVTIDNEVINSWNFDGVTDGQRASALFISGDLYTKPCLGGNQAWDWGDVDAAHMYDDVKIYANVLTSDQIAAIMTAKKGGTSSITENNTIDFNVYPNPVSNEFKLNTTENITSVEVLNIAGQSVKVWGEAQSSYSVAELNEGVYFVKVKTQNGVATKKLNIQ